MAKKRILLVDDDRSVVRILQLVLQREGYEVLVAYDGPEGLHQAWQEKPDLVVLDVEMPSMDGYEVCRRLHMREETTSVPVLMLTSKGRLSGSGAPKDKRTLYQRLQERAKGFDAGAIEFLSKPIVAKEVVEAAERIFHLDEGG
jgi:DNA-binding response OmpR family regulator